MADVEPLDPDVQRELSDQPQAIKVEIVPGLTALARPGTDVDALRDELLGYLPDDVS